MRQIENTVADLRSAQYNTFDRHIKKLSRLLHSPELGGITQELSEGIDLDIWLEAGLSTQGGMVGSAVLTWPPEHEKELGTVVLLIDRFAEKPDGALNFSNTFYYAGNQLTDNLQSMARQMIVTFARDYINYVKAKAPEEATPLKPTDAKPSEVLLLKPTFVGMSVDLKELWRRGSAWWRGKS